MSFKNHFRRPMTAKPHMLRQYGSWVCSNEHARAEDPDPRRAYREWQYRHERWANNPARLAYVNANRPRGL